MSTLFFCRWQICDCLHHFHRQAVCKQTTQHHCLHFKVVKSLIVYTNFTSKQFVYIQLGVICFPFTAGKSEIVYTNFTGKQFEADKDGSYMCNSDETLKLSDNVKMETWGLQYFAFENRIDFSEDSMHISC